jgi:hypothetical protein
VPQWQLAGWTEVEVGSKVGREARKARWVSLSSAMVRLRMQYFVEEHGSRCILVMNAWRTL